MLISSFIAYCLFSFTYLILSLLNIVTYLTIFDVLVVVLKTYFHLAICLCYTSQFICVALSLFAAVNIILYLRVCKLTTTVPYLVHCAWGISPWWFSFSVFSFSFFKLLFVFFCSLVIIFC